MDRFISKRNQVFLQDGVVIKKFPGRESAETEARILREYYDVGIAVPKVLEQRETELVLEYIPGETIPDFLARMGPTPDDDLLWKAAAGLCAWFKCFYEAVDHTKSKEIRGDVNGRNFIITGRGVISVDFEERVIGRAEQDIGRLLAFICTYNFDEVYAKRQLARLFKQEVEKRLCLFMPEILKQFRLELAAMKKRRRNI